MSLYNVSSLELFKRSGKDKSVAFCNLCCKQLGCKGSSTTPLLNHLKIHNINLKSSLTTPPIDIALTTTEQMMVPHPKDSKVAFSKT